MSGLAERFAFAVGLGVEAGTLALHMRRGLRAVTLPGYEEAGVGPTR